MLAHPPPPVHGKIRGAHPLSTCVGEVNQVSVHGLLKSQAIRIFVELPREIPDEFISQTLLALDESWDQQDQLTEH